MKLAMDGRFRQILSDAEYALAVVGDASTGEFSLVDPSLASIEDFLGVVGIVQGRPRSAFVDELPQQMLDGIRKEFCGRIETALCELERIFFKPAN
jgi:hypothetical protein